MKRNKILKTTVIILAIILIVAISFIGIYTEYLNSTKNVVKEYSFGRELSGARKIRLELDDTVTTIKYDKDGKEIPASDTETEVVSTEKIFANPEESKTTENYQKAKEILEKRLEQLQVSDYVLRQDESGAIVVELPDENDVTDSIISVLAQQGKFEIVDTQTKEVLLDNHDIEKASGGIGTVSSGYVAYLSIQFNKEATEKLKEITNMYIKDTNSQAGENTVDSQENEEENSTETSKKTVSLQVDGTTIMEDSFDGMISDGVLQLTIGSVSTTTTSETFLNNYETALTEAVLLNNGETPVKYAITQNKYIKSDITRETLKIIAYVAIVGVGVILSAYFSVTYKGKGLLASLISIGYIALLLLVIRYANVNLSINGLVAIALSVALQYLFVAMVLKAKKQEEEKSYRKVLQEFVRKMVPVIIIATVFTFSGKLIISSFGMVMFWGILLNIFYNAIVTKTGIVD